MSRSTANVSFYCRESKKNRDGLAPVELVIILNTRRCFIQLPRKEYPYQFRAQTKGNKTGVFYTAVILEQGVEILKKYHFKLPIIGNHKLNVYLKAIRDLCGIDKPIFSHVARHTYATRCLNRGIRLEVVAKLLGHSTTRITQHYAKLLQNNILNEVKDAFEKSY